MIRIVDVTKLYGKSDMQCIALEHVNLAFPEKGLVFIEGDSGSGKTTLLNCIAGYDTPTSGKVETDFGKNFCAVVFQDFQLIDMLSVRRNLELVQDIMPHALCDIDTLAQEYGLSEQLHKYPNQISGGQKQRVAVLRAVAENRPVILCDEPTGNLDEENAAAVARLLQQAAREKLVIVASHDVRLFEAICCKHIVLQKGKVVKDENKPQDAPASGQSGEQRNGERAVHAGIRSQLRLACTMYRKNLAKNILLAVALALSFLILFSAVNGLCNTYGSVVYNVHRRYADSAPEFILQDKTYADEWSSLCEEDFAYVAAKGKVQARFVDNDFRVYDDDGMDELCCISRWYVADTCDRPVLCGDARLPDSTVAISDYIADLLLPHFSVSDYDGLIGKTLADKYRIGCVYATPYSHRKGKEPTDGERERLYQTAYISYDTLLAYPDGQVGVCLIANGQALTPYSPMRTEIPTKAEHGQSRELQADEMAISVGIADMYLTAGQSRESLIGQTISLQIANYRSLMDKTPYATYTLTRKVAFIVRGAGEVIVNETDFKEIAPLYNGRFFGTNVWGVRMRSVSKSATQKLIKNSYTDASYLSDEIAEGYAWQRTLSFIELAIGAVMFIVCVVMLCHHMASLVGKEKRTLGVLVSLGLRVRQTVFMFLAGVLFTVAVCFAVAALAEIAVVATVNAIMIRQGITKIATFFYEPLTVLYIFAAFAVLLLLCYLILLRALSKKQIADIIYER